MFRHRQGFGVFFGNGCFNCPFFGRHFFFRRFHNRFGFVPYSIYAAPYYPYYPYYAEPYYPVEQTEQQAPYPDTALIGEIANLRDEVAQLRADEAAREQARQAAVQPPVNQEKPPTTVLVFRDGHRSEIQNYAIVGQTLWVFTESRATKIPISNLDKEATRNANASRGVEIRLP